MSKWIWIKEQPEPDEVLNTQVVWYRHSFPILDKEPAKRLEKCLLTIAVDNDAEIWLNGTRIGKYDGYHPPKELHVERYLKLGQNELKMKIANWGDATSTPESNPAGVNYTIIAYPKN